MHWETKKFVNLSKKDFADSQLHIKMCYNK